MQIAIPEPGIFHQSLTGIAPCVRTVVTSPTSIRDELKEILKSRSVLRGDYTLASRESSNVYIDVKIAALDPEGANLISEIFLEKIKKEDSVTGVGCALSVGGTPLVGAIVSKSRGTGRQLRGFVVREERKTHGTGKIVEGESAKGARVVMVEDVINTGGSLMKAIGRLEEEGAEVYGVFCVVDRGEETEKVFEEKGYKFFSIFKSSELV